MLEELFWIYDGIFVLSGLVWGFVWLLAFVLVARQSTDGFVATKQQ